MLFPIKLSQENSFLFFNLDHAGPPEQLRVEKIDGGGSVRLYWNQPKENGGSKIIGYEIVVTGEKGEIRKSTTTLAADVKLNDNKRYVIRVCSLNKTRKIVNSCTKPYEIERGK